VTGLDAQWGLRAKRAAGAFLAISNLSVAGSRIMGTIAGTMGAGDEISYARYGSPTTPGTHAHAGAT
jgi:hypothetical protein